MRKTKKMNICMLLLTLVMANVAIVSCRESLSENEMHTSNRSDAITPTSELSTVEQRMPHSVPTDTLDFNGEELNQASVEWQGYEFYFFAEEENGDVMNDALYTRRRNVEDQLNIQIVTEMFPLMSFYGQLKPIILSGDDVYDLMFNHCIHGIANFVAEGCLYNLDLMPYIDMKSDWWNREQMDALRLGENTYYAVNDMMIPCPYVIYFSKDLVAQYDMENPYQLVYDGRWTLDKFEEMARTASSDINGDGKMDNNDSWGIAAADPSTFISFMVGGAQYITGRAGDGRVELAMNTEKTHSIIERFASMAKNDIIYESDNIIRTNMLTLDSGRLMFQLDGIASAEMMRDYTVDFGFLPYPKFDESQEQYCSLDWGGLLSVPCSISNPDMVGASLELLAWESSNEVIPTYYDTILTGKLARDEDSVKMMDLLFDSIAYEIGGNYFGFSSGFDNLFYVIPNLALKEKSADFTSFYTIREKGANKTIKRYYESLDAIESISE